MNSPNPLPRTLAGLFHWAATFAALFSLALAALFFVRRAAGGFPQQLSNLGFLAAAVALALVALGVRLGFAGKIRPSHQSDRLLFATPTIMLALAGLAVTLNALPWGGALFWVVVAVEEAVAWHWLRGAQQAPSESPTERSHEDQERRVVFEATEEESLDDASDEEFEDEEFVALDPEVSQQITRSQTSHGEVIHGFLRGRILPGEERISIHLPFCPPFQKAPEVTAEQSEGPTAIVSVGMAEPFGARFDLRLTPAARQQDSVVLEVFIREPAQSSATAFDERAAG